MKIEELTYLEILEYLCQGIDLSTGEKLSDEHFLRNRTVMEALFKASLALQEAERKSKNKKKITIENFVFDKRMLENIKPIEPETNITPLAKLLADFTGLSSKIIIKTVQDYLIYLGELEIKKDIDGIFKKFATEKGIKSGIVNVERFKDTEQRYNLVLYTVKAQNIIFKNFENIINFAKNKEE